MKCPFGAIFGLCSEAFAVSFGVPVSFLNLEVGWFFCLDDMYMYINIGHWMVLERYMGNTWMCGCWVSFLDIGWY